MPLNKETFLQYPAVMAPTLNNTTLQLLLMLAVVAIYIQISYMIPLQHITYVSSLTILSGTLLLLSPQDFGQHLRDEGKDVKGFMVDIYVTPVCRGLCFYIHH